ncbi:MAG TPA: beta-ketoacyl synthase N-terminal-like domain-containing protein, partial [Labilithrix sp.]|nr:beta-ketoacyl synthase N-terminal-like domain-containing protein [Labilithrix sp.]
MKLAAPRPVALTGMAIASPFGCTPDDFWAGLLRGVAPVTPWRSTSFPELDVQVAPLGPEAFGRWLEQPLERATALSCSLVEGALRDAGIARTPRGTVLAIGTNFGEMMYLAKPPRPAPPRMMAHVAEAFGVDGPVLATPLACAAGNVALAYAFDRVALGLAPMAVAGGLDVIGDYDVGSFELFGTLTQTLPRPFDRHRDGFLLSEGGAIFVLEPLDAARARGARLLATIAGVGAAHDGAHPTRPDSSGRGLRSAIERALHEAGVSPHEVGYVNAHSPGTVANDVGEAAAYRDVFGPRGVPVSSTKSVLGHAQGGANALEAAACVLCLERQVLPPTHNVT